MNTWRLSYVEYWELGKVTDLWRNHASQFRHVSTSMSMHDTKGLLGPVKKIRAVAKENRWRRTQLREEIHEKSFRCLVQSFEWKFEILVQMQLKSIIFDVENLLCPQGCCRKRTLRALCGELTEEGPWYRLEVDDKERALYHHPFPDLETKRKVKVLVLGLDDESEKKIFMNYWGLEV